MEEYPYAIVVRGDWRPEHQKSLKNKLYIYFQSKKKSQGGDCNVQYNETSDTATVLFESSDIRDDVVSQAEHMITIENDTIKLKVSKPSDVAQQPDSAGQQAEHTFEFQELTLYGSNRPTWKLPEPFTVRVHPAIRQFLQKKELVSSISDQMGSQFCQINMDKPEVLLSPDPALLKQKGLTRRHIDGWAKNASDTFNNIVSNYAAFEWTVLHPLWTKVESKIKEVVKDLVFLDMDASKGVLTLAGVAHDLTGLKPILKKMLERASAQMEREKNSVTEDVEMTPTMFSLLLQDGLKNATAACPQLHFNYNKDMKKLHLSGLQTEILIFKNWILEKKLSIKQTRLKMDHSLLEFLTSMDCDEMSRDLFLSHGISCVYTVEKEDVILVGSTEKSLAEAEKKLKTDLIFKSLSVEDQAVLALPQCQTHISKLDNENNTPQKKVLINFTRQRNEVRVSGFSESVMKVSESLKDFMTKHTRIEETVFVKSHAVVEFIKDQKSQDWQHFKQSDEVKVNFDIKRPCIKLSGERRFVQPAMTFFKKMADALHTDTLIIKKAGAEELFYRYTFGHMLTALMNEHKFVVVLQKEHMLINTSGGSASTRSHKAHVMRVGPVTVEIVEGDITKERTCAIVNSSNHTFTLKSGVSKAILDAAGLRVEQECFQIASAPNFQQSEIVTSPGQLPCGNIIHIVGRNTPENIKNAVLSVLKICETNRLSSVAFPALGTGQGGANPAAVANAMMDAVIDFVKNERPVNVKLVKLIIFQSIMVADFNKSMLRRSGEKVMKHKSFVDMLKDWFWGVSPINEEFVIVVKEIEPVILQLCGETPQDLNKAKDVINSLIMEYLNITP